MTLRVYEIQQEKEWDDIVTSFNNYDVYWLRGYVKAFKIHGDGEPMLFHYQKDDIEGINVVMKRDISDDKKFEDKIEHGKWFDFITPYGYGGWLIKGQGNMHLLFLEYEKWCKEHSIVSEFVRFHPVLKNNEMVEQYYEVVPLGNTIALELNSHEEIWSNITSKNRNMIRKAKKNNIEIKHSRSKEIFDEFCKIYNDTMDKDNADKYYYFESSFYQSIIDDLSNEAQIFYAEYENRIIAAAIILKTNDRLHYHLSGSLSDFRKLAPTNLLLYEAALWGCDNGCKSFHLGGGVGSIEDNLYKFKKSFYQGESYRFYIGKRVFDKGKYEKLVDMRNKEPNESFFPEYRA